MLDVAAKDIIMETKALLFCTVEGCRSPRWDQNPNASNRHCSVHRNEAQRKYNVTRLTQQRGRGFVEGVEEMRQLLVNEFLNLAEGMMTGNEAAYYIRQAIGPLAKAKDDSPENEKEAKS